MRVTEWWQCYGGENWSHLKFSKGDKVLYTGDNDRIGLEPEFTVEVVGEDTLAVWVESLGDEPWLLADERHFFSFRPTSKILAEPDE